MWLHPAVVARSIGGTEGSPRQPSSYVDTRPLMTSAAPISQAMADWSGRWRQSQWCMGAVRCCSGVLVSVPDAGCASLAVLWLVQEDVALACTQTSAEALLQQLQGLYGSGA